MCECARECVRECVHVVMTGFSFRQNGNSPFIAELHSPLPLIVKKIDFAVIIEVPAARQ